MGFFDDLSSQHQRLKERIHGFRMPLSRKGRIAMNVVYFSIPVIGGHYIMQWAHGRAQINLREAGVLPAPGEPPGRSRTEKQNMALQNRLGKIKQDLNVVAGEERQQGGRSRA